MFVAWTGRVCLVVNLVWRVLVADKMFVRIAPVEAENVGFAVIEPNHDVKVLCHGASLTVRVCRVHRYRAAALLSPPVRAF
jgi:hypothetical protein